MSRFVSIACGKKEIEVQKFFDNMLASPIPRMVPEEVRFAIPSPLLDFGKRLLFFGIPFLVIYNIGIYLALPLIWRAPINNMIMLNNFVSLALVYGTVWLIGYERKRKVIKVMRLGEEATGRITGMSKRRRFLSLRRPYIGLAVDVEHNGRHYECRTHVHFLEISRIAQMADTDSPLDVLFIPGCREVVVPRLYTMDAKYANLI